MDVVPDWFAEEDWRAMGVLFKAIRADRAAVEAERQRLRDLQHQEERRLEEQHRLRSQEPAVIARQVADLQRQLAELKSAKA